MSDKQVPPSVGEFAIGERDQLLARVAELDGEVKRLTPYKRFESLYQEAERELAALKQTSAGVDERAAFEAKFPPEEGVEWNEARQLYEAFTIFDPGLQQSHDWQNSMLEVWQARAQLAATERTPMDMLKLRETALKASPWAEHADRTGAFVKGALWHAQLAAPAGVPDDACSVMGDTGREEVDRLIGRLTSSDPDFEDCTAAAVLLRRLVLEEVIGPKGYATWKDAADDDMHKRVHWPCDKCGKDFYAHCGLDISPSNGPTYRRSNKCSPTG